jgi:type I restriction enzyme S subunit
MPQNWKTYKLEEIAGVIDSLHQTPQYDEVGFPMVRVTDIKGGYLKLDNTFKVNTQVFEQFSKKYKPKKFDIVMSRVGTYGISSIVTDETPFCLGQNTVVIAPNYDPHFLFYSLNSSEVKAQIEAEVTGSTQKTISLKSIRNLKINLPPLPEQRAIASILSALDDKIELNLQMNKTLEEMAMALYKHWFVDFGPFKDGKFVESELGMIPEGWEVNELGNIARVIAGGDKPKFYSQLKSEECPIPIFSNGISDEGLYGYTNIPRITDESLTVSARGTIGCVFLRMEPFFPIVRLVSVTPEKNHITTKFLYFFLKNQNISGTGTTQQQLTVPDFKTTKILIPEISLVIRFSDFADSVFERIQCSKKEIEILKEERDSLLPKLISGEIAIKN